VQLHHLVFEFIGKASSWSFSHFGRSPLFIVLILPAHNFIVQFIVTYPLVGTRPPTVDEYEKYELHHRKSLATKPGQVSGRSNITDFEEVVALDTRNFEEWNIGLNIKILM
jgi:hypothetical protein